MSDKFNKDNDDLFSSGSGEPDEDDALDWLQSRLGGSDEPEQAGSDDMPWQQSGVPSGDQATLDDDGIASIDWTPANTSGPGRSSTGLTGQLPWLQGGGTLGAASETPDPLDWMADIPGWQSDPKPQQEEKPANVIPDWLSTGEEESEPVAAPVEPEPEPAAEQIPEWLSSADPVPEVSIYDVPDWLVAAAEEDEEASPAAPVSAEQPITADWLAGDHDVPETSGDSMTYTEWQAQQEAVQRVPDPEEEVPEWFGNLEDMPPAGEAPSPELPASGELPSWFLGMQELDTSDAPDWFVDDQQQAAPTAEAPAQESEELDWSQWETPSEPEQPAPAEPAVEPDFFSAMGADFVFSQPEPEDTVEPAQPVGNEFLASLGIEIPADEAPAQANDDDFFASIGLEPPPEIAAAQANDANFLAEFGIEPPAASVPQAEVSENEFLSSLGIGGPPVSPVQEDDFFSTFGQTPALDSDDDDFLSNLGSETPAPMGRDFFNSLNTPADERVDWFAEQPEESEPVAAEPDWMQQIESGDFTLEEPAAAQPQARLQADDDDFLADMRQTLDAEPPAQQQFQDLDSFLSALDVNAEKDLPETGELSLNTDVDFDQLLADSAISGIPNDRQGQPRILNPDAPEWLADIASGAIIGGVSAAAIVRQRKDKPLDELPERLQRLHDLGDELPPPGDAPVTGSLTDVLAGVKDTLPPAPVKPGLPGMAETVSLSERQRDRVKMLRSLVAAEPVAPGVPEPVRESAFEPDEDDPFRDLLPNESAKADSAPVVPEPVAVRRPRRRPQVDRLLITLVLALAVIAPFFVDSLRVGALPPPSFASNSAAQAAYTAVDSLSSGDLVLVAVEYAPGAAPELDLLTQSLLSHIFERGARPVLVGSSATGLLHTGTLVQTLAEARGLQINQDYYIARYLTGSLTGVRALAQQPGTLLATDRRGLQTDLGDVSLSDFALIVTIAESGESVRAWAEGAVPLARVPFIAAVTSAASPLAAPYAVGGLLVGYRDGYTYSQLLANGLPLVPPAVEDAAGTDTGTSAGTQSEADTEATAEPEAESGISEATEEASGASEPVTPRPTRQPPSDTSSTGDGSPKRAASSAQAPDAQSASSESATGATQLRWYAMTLGLMASIAVITFGALVSILRRLLRRPQR